MKLDWKNSRWTRRLLWCGVAFMIYLIIGFFIVPPILKAQLLKRLPPITKRAASIRQVRCNPLMLSLTVRGLELTEPDGQRFAAWEELYVNFQLSSLFRLAWTFDEIGLKQPYGHIAISREGRMNFANMLETTNAAPPAPKPAKPPGLTPVLVGNLHIDEGEVQVDDLTHRVALHSDFKPINIAVTNLTTQSKKDGRYAFRATSDTGKSFFWSGTLRADPFLSRGHFELTGGELTRFTPLLRDFLHAEISDGRLNIQADYTAGMTPRGLDLSVTNGAVELTTLIVKDLNSGETNTTLPSLNIKALDFSLLRKNLHLGGIQVTGYSKIVRIEKDGRLNLNLLLDPLPPKPATTNFPPTAPTAPSARWTVSMDDFSLEDGTIIFSDLSRPVSFQTRLHPISIHVKQFSTATNAEAAYDFTIPTESAESVSGAGHFSVTPLQSSGGIKLAAFEIKKYAPYFQDRLHGEITAGKMSAHAEYRFVPGSNGPVVTISNAGLALVDLALKSADTGETVVSLPSFTVEQTEASLVQQTAQVGLIKSTGGSILVRQSKDGALNLLGLMRSPAPQAGITNLPPGPAAATNSPAPPWTVVLKEIAFENYAVKFEDLKPATPATQNVDQIAFNFKGLSTVSNTPVTTSFSARLNEGGTVGSQGTLKLTPVMADMDVSVSAVDLRPFQPYVNEQIKLGFTSGQVNTRGHARFGPEKQSTPLVKFTGDFGLTNLVTTDLALGREFVKWDALTVSGIALELQPNQLQIEEVRWRGFKTSVVIGPDGQSNLKTILPAKPAPATNQAVAKAPAPAPATPATPAAPAADFPMKLGALVLEKTSFQFVDNSIQPRVDFNLEELNGSIKNLSSESQSTAVVDLSGRVDARSPFTVAGKINPLAKDLLLDLAVSFTNTDLTAFTPYMEKYAGHPLNKGRLSLDIHYDIQQKQLKAGNKFRIDQLTLGARTDSTNATKLPVRLAIALLKDRNGRIDLDIPLSGRTDDPEFKVGPLIWKVIGNLLVKAATSPFSLLGAAFGGGEELSFVQFEPGQSVVVEAEAQKLDKLSKALYERPALSLEITGAVDPLKDREVLTRVKLEEQLLRVRNEELVRAGKTPPPATTNELAAVERERLVKLLFSQLAQTNLNLAAKTNLAAQASATNPPVTTAGAAKKDPSTPKRTAVSTATSGAKGAGMISAAPPRPVTSPSPAKPAVPTATPGAVEGALTLVDLEAEILKAFPVTEADFRALMKQRSQAVEAYLLKTEKITAERLFIVLPKTTTLPAKGESRVILSLN